LQKDILSEGRHFRDIYNWDWKIYPMVEIPEGKLGVRIRLHGDDLKDREFVALEESQKGIVPKVLMPGRYPINAKVIDKSTGMVVLPRPIADYLEVVELYEPITIPAGFKGCLCRMANEEFSKRRLMKELTT
jgi:hypothetical protein